VTFVTDESYSDQFFRGGGHEMIRVATPLKGEIQMTTDPSWTIDDLQIAKRCPADWNDMVGTERVRLCGKCKLHVYNFSELTRDEAQSIALENDGQFCARFYRRADGTMLTKDCPLPQRLYLGGLVAASKTLSWVAAFALMIVGVVMVGSNLKQTLSVAISSAFAKIIDDIDKSTVGSVAAPYQTNNPK